MMSGVDDLPDFASDNVAGIAPAILAALERANRGTAAAYGADAVTDSLQARFGDLFESRCFVHPLATGTAANALALSLLTPPYGAVFCAEGAHVQDSECGAGEFFTGGAKLLPLPAEHGRLALATLERANRDTGWGLTHVAQPAALSLTQPSECGTVYDLEHLRALTGLARRHRLRIHIDGARLANAVGTLQCGLAELTWQLGIDVLSFGATKNGAMAAEALVVFDPELAPALRYRARRAGQVFSKMRFISAQLEAYIEDRLWLRLARNANAMARRLADGLGRLPGVELRHPVEINQIFAAMPRRMIDRLLRQGFGLDDWGEAVRLVTAFNTTAAQVDAFVDAPRSTPAD